MATIHLGISGALVQVDDADLADLTLRSWYRMGRYAAAYIKGRSVLMHRYLLGATEGQEVDHINRDPLDNRRANLRVCSRVENSRNRGLHRNNTSGCAGVYRKPNGSWRARIMVRGRKIEIGTFKTFELASAARREAEQRIFSGFAPIH